MKYKEELRWARRKELPTSLLILDNGDFVVTNDVSGWIGYYPKQFFRCATPDEEKGYWSKSVSHGDGYRGRPKNISQL